MANSRNCESPDLLSGVVAACLRRHLKPGQTLVVGFSGGRDSVALLHVLHRLQGQIDFHLAACHVNHGLSPHAEEWQLFCHRVCEEWGIPVGVVSVAVPRGSPEGLEAAARNKRYAAFSDVIGDWVVLAQHRGDQAETLLFNLLRGTGLAGMAGMSEIRPLRHGMGLMRPWLNIPRSDIDAYLAMHQLAWVEDESNRDTGFTRNFIRHHVLPLLQSRFPAAERKLASATAHFSEAQRLLDELAMLDLGKLAPIFPLPLSCLTGISEPRGRNLLRFLLARHGVGIPSEERLREAMRQLMKARQDRHPAVVFGNRLLCRRRDQVHLELLDAIKS